MINFHFWHPTSAHKCMYFILPTLRKHKNVKRVFHYLWTCLPWLASVALHSSPQESCVYTGLVTMRSWSNRTIFSFDTDTISLPSCSICREIREWTLLSIVKRAVVAFAKQCCSLFACFKIHENYLLNAKDKASLRHQVPLVCPSQIYLDSLTGRLCSCRDRSMPCCTWLSLLKREGRLFHHRTFLPH